MKYKLWQRDGRWCCTSAGHEDGWCEADTADEAIAMHEKYLKHFAQFQRHLRGECDPSTCEQCQDKECRVTRGALPKKRRAKA